MGFTWESITLRLINPFALSYGVSETRQVFWLRLKDDEGWGEAAIPPYYGVAAEEMTALWLQANERCADLPETPEELETWVGKAGPAPARAALDLALLDRLGRQARLPLHALLGLPQPKPMPTSFTIAIASPEEMARRAQAIPHFTAIKIKLGSEDDLARLQAVRAARPDAALRVDANAGWNFEQAARILPSLEALGVELLEQPLPKEDIPGLGELQKRTPIPIVADEAVQSVEDIDRLAEAGAGGVNLKLMKLGGVLPALRALKRAKACSLKVLLGCMIETSLGVSAASHLLGLADWADLDAPLLIANDPFSGVHYDSSGQVHAPVEPGIGVRRRE